MAADYIVLDIKCEMLFKFTPKFEMPPKYSGCWYSLYLKCIDFPATFT